MPLPRLRSYDDQLTAYFRDQRGIPLMDMAVVAAAASEEFAAATHLLDLLAAIPLPAGDRDFWHDLWKASGSAELVPANIGPRVVRALEGDPGGLADQVLSAFSQISASHRAEAADVVGAALSETPDLAGYDHTYIGARWLADLEQTAWRVLLAARTRTQSFQEARRAFREGWQGE